MKYIIIYALVFIAVSCSHGNNCHKNHKNHKNGKAVLVAYKVAKHSHLWFQNPETKQIYDIGNVGGRREPNINLGDTIPVQYCNGEIIFNCYDYVIHPNNHESRVIYLDGFSGLD